MTSAFTASSSITLDAYPHAIPTMLEAAALLAGLPPAPYLPRAGFALARLRSTLARMRSFSALSLTASPS